MTDIQLIEKKLAFIETCVRELKELARPEQIETDTREERFVAYTLQIAIQAALDIASHIVSDLRLGEPETNRQMFDQLLTAGWLPRKVAEKMYKLSGFRNIVVHGYQAVNPKILRDIVENRLDDLLQFAITIRYSLKK